MAGGLVSSIKKLSLIGPLAFRSDAVKLENFRFEEGEGDNERTRFNLNVILKIILFFFFNQKRFTVIFIEEVNPSPVRKLLKLLTF